MVIIVICGSASLVATHALVSDFRSSAEGVEQEATATARLKANLVAHSVAVGNVIDPSQVAAIAELEAVVRAEFADVIALEASSSAAALLVSARDEWEALTADTAGMTDVFVRGAAVSTRAPLVLQIVDRAGSASRQAVRADLARSANLERLTIGLLAALQGVAIVLAIGLARRLSRDVIGPVGVLRDSAIRWATGDLDHRIPVERADELGQLAASFNTMADAVAGSQRTLIREASTDSLTGLTNRAGFSSRLAAALSTTERRGGSQAVLFADLDDFKDVNDTLGHAAGDELLCEAARRLSTAVRPGDLVARLGGDEFAMLLEGLDSPREAVEIGQRVLDAFTLPVAVGSSSVRVEASIGLAHRRSNSTAAQLMHDADVAMYSAKANGKNRVEEYDAVLDDLTKARLELRSDIVDAVERRELVVEYQPVIDLDTGLVKGAEALVRWQHPARGLLAPAAFIELAEETGAIFDIGAWVLSTAARQLQAWQRRFDLPHLWVSVNVSMRQLDGPGFAAEVTEVLAATGLDPTTLVIEVTESVLADPDGAAAVALVAVRARGVRVALGDFGTGYS
ncbi:MAG: diguanylate cyclase, partial [Actinobacteria bacterium]|nr:diguanylate cyclase [Actinomycetota bacterium]